MDVKDFFDELLRALTDTELFEQVAFQTEGPIVSGQAYLFRSNQDFLRVYFNGMTGTIAFALIEKQQQVWGIDYDNRRGWHLHPVENPTDHVGIAPMSVSDIVARLQTVLLMHE